MSDFIDLPVSDSLDIELFKEKQPFKSFKPFLESKNKVGFGFSGEYSDVEIELIDDFKKDIILEGILHI